MAGLRTINLKTGEDSAVNGGGSGGGQIPANVVTRDDIFDSNGKIRADIIDVSIDGQSLSLKEDSSNKVTTIDSSSTHQQFPSAKAVYDVLTSAIGAIDVSIDPASLEGKEDSSNKVTVIDSSSTDEQYPSAKAVYDALVESKNVIFCSDSEFWGLDPDESALYIVKETLTPTFGGYAISPLIQYRDGKNTFSEKYFNYEKYLELEATADSEGWSDEEWENAFNNITLDYENVDFGKYGNVEGSYYLSFSEGGGHGFNIETDGEYCWWSGLGTYDFYFNILNNRTGSTLAWYDGNSTVETPNVLYAHARIDGKKHGLLLFPDNFHIWHNGDNNLIVNFLRLPNGAEYKNEITREELINLLMQGCEFIPAMGYSNANNSYTNLDSELCLLTGSYYTASGKPMVFDWDCNQKDISYNGVAKDKDSFRTISKFFSKNAVKVIYNFYLGRKLVFSTHKDEENSSEDSSETGGKIVCLTRTEYNTLVENEEINPDKFYVVEDKGASFGGLVIAPTQLVYDGNKFYIPEFGEDVDTGAGEDLPPIEIEPPLTSTGSTSLYDYACINSSYSKCGKTAGSTYFAPQTDLINELVNPNAQTDDGMFIPISSLGYDDWKIMAGADFQKIFDPESRPGATVNGNENCLYAFIYVSESGGPVEVSASDPNAGNNEDRFGVLIFPDGVNVEGAAIDNFNYTDNSVNNGGVAYAVNGNAQFATWISPEDVNHYISQGCVFIPMLGSAYSADNEISWDDSWAPILTSNGIYDFNEYGFNINEPSDSLEEYIPIRLVSKKAAEDATTYTVYKGDNVIVDGNDRKELKNKVNYVKMTQQEFVNLKNKDPKTLYVVTGAATEDVTVEGELMPSFGGVAIAPTQLFYDGETFHIGAPAPESIDSGDDSGELRNDNDGYFGWDLNSYNDVYGLEPGSTYFSYDDLVQTFDSDGDPEVPIDNEGLKLSYNGFDDWRMMTYDDIQKFFNPELREGSTVNGTPNVLYAIVKVNDVEDQGILSSFSGGENFGMGILMFPDGLTINGASVDDTVNLFGTMDESDATYGYEGTRFYEQPQFVPELKTEDINEYVSQGCIFLPSLGHYEYGSQSWWGNDDTNNYNFFGIDYYYAGHLDSSAKAYFDEEEGRSDINPTREWISILINDANEYPDLSFNYMDSSTYSEYTSNYGVCLPVRLVSTTAAQGGSKSVPKTSVYLGDILITGESVTENGFVFVTRAEYEALGSNINPNKFYVVEDGAAGGGTTAKFGDIEVAPTQLMWSEDRGGFFIPTLEEALEIANAGGGSAPEKDAEPTPEDIELWNNLYMYSVINSNGDYVGREEYSTYFSYNELGQFFSSAGDSFDGESDIDNKGGKVTFNGKSWRLPTKEEMRALFDNTKRTGATVDGIANACWAPVFIGFTSGDEPIIASDIFSENSYAAIIVFPDDVEIDAELMGIEFKKINPTEEESRYEPQPKGLDSQTQLDSIQLGYLLSKGCLILPMLAFYQESSGGGLYNAEDVPEGWWCDAISEQGIYMTATKDYCYYINNTSDIYDDDAYAYFEDNGWDVTPIWGTVRLVTEAAGNQSYKVYKNGQVIFDSNNTTGSNETVAEIKNELKNKVDGEILTPEEYNNLIHSGEIDSDKIYFVGRKAMHSFGGVAIAPIQYVHDTENGKYFIASDEDYDVLRNYDYCTYGKQNNTWPKHTTYFSFNDLSCVFNSEGNSSIIDSSNQITEPLDNKIYKYDNGNIITSYNGYDDWRLPTKDDLEAIFDGNRGGSYIKLDGADKPENIQILPVWIKAGEYDWYYYNNEGNSLFAYILFPDDVVITVSLDIAERTFDDNELTRSDVEFWMSKGCVILPAFGFYENYNTPYSYGEVGLYMFTGDAEGNTAFTISDDNGFQIEYVDPWNTYGTVRLVSKNAAIGEFRVYKGATPLYSNDNIDRLIDNKINGEILDVVDFSDKQYEGSIKNDSIYIVSERVGELPSFGGISLSQGPLYVDSNGDFAIDTNNPFRNSYDSSIGMVEGSTFFTTDQLFDYFNSSDTYQDNVIDNARGRLSAYGYNDWRVPTIEDFKDKIFNLYRNGSYFNGSPNYRWALAAIKTDCRMAIVIFPDDKIIRLDDDNDWHNTKNIGIDGSKSINRDYLPTITKEQAESLIKQGCVILPAYGDYNVSRDNWCSTNSIDGLPEYGVYLTGSISASWSRIRSINIATHDNSYHKIYTYYPSNGSSAYSSRSYGMVHLVSDDACRKNINIYKGNEIVLGNKIDEIKASSTVDELPSAKAVYRYVNEKLGDIENLLSQI